MFTENYVLFTVNFMFPLDAPLNKLVRDINVVVKWKINKQKNVTVAIVLTGILIRFVQVLLKNV